MLAAAANISVWCNCWPAVLKVFLNIFPFYCLLVFFSLPLYMVLFMMLLLLLSFFSGCFFLDFEDVVHVFHLLFDTCVLYFQ